MARLQRPRAAARRGSDGPAARAGQVLRHLSGQPRRVLHGPCREPSRADRGRQRRTRRRRDEPLGGDRDDPRSRLGAARAAGGLLRARPASRAGRARRPPDLGRLRERRRARPARGAVREPDLPHADAARDRPRPALPLHLQPLAQPRGGAARPRPGGRGGGAGQGPEGAPAPLPRARGREHVRLPGGRDRAQPRGAVPRNGDRRSRAVPGHARHRLRRLRRGGRSDAGRRGRAAPAALRRGGTAGGRARHRRATARPARRGPGDRGGPGVRGRGHARHGRPVGHSRGGRDSTSCVTRRSPASPSRVCRPRTGSRGT